MSVTVELYGVPRLRAGVPAVVVEAGSARDVLRRLVAAVPALAGVVAGDGGLSPQYLLSVNGERFVADLGEAVPAGARLLLLSADAGG